MLLHNFLSEFALKGLNKCLSVDTRNFGFPNMCLKSNISQPISIDTIRSKPIISKPIRGSAYRPIDQALFTSHKDLPVISTPAQSLIFVC